MEFALFGLGDSMYEIFCAGLLAIEPALKEKKAIVYPNIFQDRRIPTDRKPWKV